MKILFPATHYYPVIGGIENWTQNIAEKLALGGAEVFVVTGRVKYQPEKQVLNGVRIWRTSLFALSNLSASPLAYTLSLLPFVFLKSLLLIKKDKINILHCQGFLSGFLGFFLSKLTGIPFVVTVQRIEGRNNPLKNFIYRMAYFCIGASRAIKDYFEKIGCERIEVIPNGIDLKRFEGLERSSHQGFVVITVARLEKVKGIEYLIRAISILKTQIPGLTCFIVGDGSERKNLESLTKRLGLEAEVKFVGQIPPEGIPEYLARADCFVLPSLKEGFGIAVLESIAAAVPIVATKVGGILDIIEDGKTGLLTEPGNFQQIARAIEKIYDNPSLKDELVSNAMTTLTRYDWQNISKKVLKIYQRAFSLKIVLATGIYPPDIGGPATYVSKLTLDLKDMGCEAKIITYADKDDLKSRSQNFKHQIDPRLEIARISRKYPKGLRHFLYFLRLLFLARGINVIYAQNVTSAGLPAMLAAKLLRKKFVLKVVGDAAWEQKKSYLRFIQSRVAKGADKIIVPSRYVKKMAVSWGAGEEKINVIYNAIDRRPGSDNSKEEAKKIIGVGGDIILSVGRLVPWKGFNNLISAMPDLLKENPDFQLVIVGDGEEKLFSSENIKLAGRVSYQQMPCYFEAADIFVLDSKYEGLSHVILEAMHFGVPVIASSEGGNPELIENDFNGFLVEYNNQGQLKSAILKLWRNKELQEKFIRNSREKLKNFTWENLMEKTLRILND